MKNYRLSNFDSHIVRLLSEKMLVIVHDDQEQIPIKLKLTIYNINAQ